MKLFNNKTNYGLLSIFLHWVMAIIIVALFFLGEYMVDLDYYDQWYHQAPWWHKGIGISLFSLLSIRLILKFGSASPTPLTTYKKWETTLSRITHLLFYFLLLTICISGYFIATAKGSGIDVFSWFEIAALAELTESQTDLSGDIHEISTRVLVVLFLLHVVAAVKHHVINRDITLIRMLGKKTTNL